MWPTSARRSQSPSPGPSQPIAGMRAHQARESPCRRGEYGVGRSRRVRSRPSPRRTPGCAAPGRRRSPTGRTSLPSRFCSRMCAHQPAVRPQVNIAGIIVGGHLGEVEDDRGPELDVGLDRAVGAALAQFGQRGLLECGGHLVARAPRAAWRCARSTRARGSSARYTRCPKPISFSLRSRMPLTTRAGVAGALDLFDHRQHPRRARRRAAGRSSRRSRRTAPPRRRRRSRRSPAR